MTAEELVPLLLDYEERWVKPPVVEFLRIDAERIEYVRTAGEKPLKPLWSDRV